MKEPIDVSKILPSGKITREQAEAMRLMPFGKKHPVRILIESLQPGEMLNISRADFQWRRQSPSRFCNELAQKTKRKFSMLKKSDRTGWVVVREE